MKGFIYKTIKGIINWFKPNNINISKSENNSNYLLLTEQEFIKIFDDSIKNHQFYGCHHADGNVYFCLNYMNFWWSGKFNFLKCNDNNYYIQIYKVNIKECLHCGSIHWETK